MKRLSESSDLLQGITNNHRCVVRDYYALANNQLKVKIQVNYPNELIINGITMLT